MTRLVDAILRKDIDTISESFTRPANPTAYASGDAVVAATPARIVFTKTLREGKKSGEITALKMTSSSATAFPDAELWLFDTDITSITDNAAFTVDNTEIQTAQAVIDIAAADWTTSALNKFAQVTDLNIPFSCVPTNVSYPNSSTKTLYGALVVRGSYTPISGEVFTFELLIRQD